jgi:hypothetical protein
VNDCQAIKNSQKKTLNEFESNYNKYRDWSLLSTPSYDNNCFFVAFSILLAGKPDRNLTEELRVAAILEVINNNERYSWGNSDEERLESIRKSIFENFSIGRKGTNQVDCLTCQVMSHVLKRPITNIIIRPYKESPLLFHDYDCSDKRYNEEWVIYYSGAHFEPLIP